jgi:hypothetical protein
VTEELANICVTNCRRTAKKLENGGKAVAKTKANS